MAGYKPEHSVPPTKIARSINVFFHPNEMASGSPIRIFSNGKLA
jgi:hypothetical protein